MKCFICGEKADLKTCIPFMVVVILTLGAIVLDVLYEIGLILK